MRATVEELEQCRKQTEAFLRELFGSAPAFCSQDNPSQWSRSLPTESGLWWWWNGDEDSLPIVVDIAYSGTSGSCFAMAGQHGWSRYQNVEDMGGWWMVLPVPQRPENSQLNKPSA